MDSRVNEPTGLQKALDAVENGARRVATGVKQFVMTFNARATYAMSYLMGRTQIDYAAEVGDPTRNSIVVAAVGWIARNFPEAPVRVARVAADDSREYVPMAQTGAGAMLRLLERPNAFFSGTLLWTATIVDLYTTGNAYWIKVRGDRTFPDRVTGLWWVPKKLMKPAWPEDGSQFISEYHYTVDGEVYRLDPSDVIHFRDGIDPDNIRLGRSKLASLFREIFTDDEAANFSAVLLKNFGVPGVIISPANTTAGVGQKTDTAAVKQKFIDTFGGDGRGEPMVMSGPTDIKVLSFNPEQMDLRGLRRVPEERITAVLGVAAIVAGLGAGLDHSTFTNYREARSAAYEESVIPMQRLIAAELEVQLLDDFVDLAEGWDVDFDLRNVRALAEDVDAVWKRNESSATKGLLKRSDFKRSVGLPVEEEDEVYVVPSNYIFVPFDSSPAAPAGLTAIGAPQAPPPVASNGHDPSVDVLAILAQRDQSFSEAMARRDDEIKSLMREFIVPPAPVEPRDPEWVGDVIKGLSDIAKRPVQVSTPVTIEKGAIELTMPPAVEAPSRPSTVRKSVKRDPQTREILEVIEEHG